MVVIAIRRAALAKLAQPYALISVPFGDNLAIRRAALAKLAQPYALI
jgi:hypothetical protein